MPRRQVKTDKKRSQKQEARLAKEYKGRTQPASGAFAGFKGDVVSKHLFIEAKITGKKQYTLRLEDLQKVERQCPPTGRIPVMIITFELARRDFAIITKEDLDVLLQERK